MKTNRTNARNYLLANEDTYRKLSTFETVDQLNEAIRKHRSNNNLSETETAVLDLISRYSCKFPGVSYMTKNKIGAILGKSRRTIIRVCNRLESLGIIRQYDLKRVSGDKRQTSNAIVIQSDVQSGVTPTTSRQKAQQPIKQTNTLKETATTGQAREEKAPTIPVTALRNSIPKAIYDALSPFYDVNGLYETYGVLLRAKASIDRTITFEDYAKPYIDEFMNIIRKHKLGQVLKINGLLYSAWQKVTAEVSRRVKTTSVNSKAKLFEEVLTAI